MFRKYGGKCHISGAKIGPKDAWHTEHIHALADGGENRESNLAPALIEPHKAKSKAEAAARKKADKAAKRHVGIKGQPKRPIASRGFAKADKPSREAKPALTPRAIYR